MLLTNIFFPHQCIICSKVGVEICERCLRKIPKALPMCFICGKISMNGTVHMRCSIMDNSIKYLQGWNISKKEYREFYKKKKSSTYSVYRYLLLDILERQNIHIRSYKVLPIQETPIDKYLVNVAHSNNYTAGLCFIGESISNKDDLIERIRKNIKNSHQEILIISIFNRQ